LHLLVLIAYGLSVLHVAYGVLQSERSAVYAVLLLAAAVTVYGLHIAAGWREAKADRVKTDLVEEGFVSVCRVGDLTDGAGRTAWLGSRRVALWRHEGKIYATSNVCRHQGGPLGEGEIIDGCITCPWHGWQYRPADGQSPPPFDERVATYRTRVVDGDVWVAAEADPAGTSQHGAAVEGEVRDG
ncbi:MAG: Rieske (2Fe-2S) protein, partial [Acidobacteriota bacterium]